ncbi:peptidoglycan editing factor PgeF [Candidatus Thiosymbion oneisti]|uniref:peptidoglycan editing factor PgeF n=1 Tax=Candidatus Thiosymbion oneisti TaxID=589554 RepID=UPI000A66AB7F|nr:peptidoglycan editing factor PgeF [Candidatus Thiosymbion oneisti]
MSTTLEWRIEPSWPAPPRVRALCTTRGGGVSTGPFAGLNLADHVGDEPSLVVQNRALLRARLGLPTEPHWLRQVHGCRVADAVREPRACRADAVIAMGPREVCAVLTADCLPLLLCDAAGTRVAAVHAGWRGLAQGIIEATIARLAVPPRVILCWLGPAIGPETFEVGAEVRARFLAQGGKDTKAAFVPAPGDKWGDKWLANLYALARERLRACGVDRVWGGEFCTYSDPERFFSYRRDKITGRMASLIWIDPDAG